MDARNERLLAADEPPAFTVVGEAAPSPFLFCCDHASKRIPRRLGDLGLPATELSRHIAWDIGIAAVTGIIAEALEATLVLQNYSRLVIDCNRRPTVAASVPTVSELTEIPGNEKLGESDRIARIGEIFTPYQKRIGTLIDERSARGQRTILVAMHSFTPVYMGEPRPWHMDIMYNRDRRLAGVILEILHDDGQPFVGDNEPYAVTDETDYTIPVHGEGRGIAHVEIEIRQDLITAPEDQQAWAARMISLFARALAQFDKQYP